MNDSVIGDSLSHCLPARDSGSADMATVPFPLNLGAANKDRSRGVLAEDSVIS